MGFPMTGVNSEQVAVLFDDKWVCLVSISIVKLIIIFLANAGVIHHSGEIAGRTLPRDIEMY